MTRRLSRLTVWHGLGLIFLTTVGLGFVTASGSNAPDETTPGPVYFQAEDHLPSESAEDWVRGADFVVAVTAVEETDQPISRDTLEEEEGIIGRDVTLLVDEVLWRRPDTKVATPETITWSAAGSTFSGGNLEKRQQMIGVGAPRIEVEHRYLLAIRWEPGCRVGVDDVPARWAGLGAGAVLPFDEGVIGNGEFEGRERSVGEARRETNRASDEQLDFGQTLVGLTGSDLSQLLQETQKSRVTSPLAPTHECG
jgi:hypothetical protein